MAGLTRGNIPKKPIPVNGVKIETVSTLEVSDEMQIIQDVINRNKAEIMRSIEKMGEDQALATLKYERIEFKKNLELAQINITEMDKYLKLAMETVQKDTATSIKKITEKVDQLESSNKIVTTTIASESEKLTKQSKNTIENLGVNAKDSIEKSLKSLDINFKSILDTHKQIASTVEQIYAYKGYRILGLWAWRWVMMVTALYMLQHIFGIDSWGSWFKVLTGIALL